MTTQEKFDSKWTPEPFSGCWLWTGSTVGKLKYGEMYFDSKRQLSHRLSWELHHGAIPSGMYVCHKCDTPSCVNPDHLFLGTLADNNHDMMRKGRMVRHTGVKGEKNNFAKLTASQVLAIRAASGTHREIGERFGTCESNVGEIRNRRKWRHI